MYVVSDEFKSAIQSTSRLMSCKAYLNGAELTVDTILKMDIEDNINNGDYFTIGEVPSRSLTIEMIGVQGLVEGDEIKPYYGVEVSPGKFEYVPCGVFYVDSLTINKDKISATCYDKMLKLDDEYIPNITIPVTLSEIMDDICRQKEVEFEGQLPNITVNKSIKGYSYREMVGFIASFCGGNAKFNRLGKLVIQRYAQTGKVVNPNVCASFEHKDVYAVSAIACKFGDVANTRGDSSANCVNFTNPYVDDSNIDSIFNLLNGLTFTAATLKYKGDPSVDSGDLITVHDIKGTARTVLISTQSFTFSGGLSSEVTSIGEGKGANAYKQYKFKNKKTITELNVELGLIQGIISEVQEKQEDTYTKTETETLIEAKAGEISLSVAKNEVNNLQIGGANLYNNTCEIVTFNGVSNVIRTETGFSFLGVAKNDGTLRVTNLIKSAGWYTISFMVKTNVEYWDMNVEINDAYVGTVVAPSDHYRYVSFSHYVGENNYTDYYNFVDFEGLSAQTYDIKNFKVEKGQKATDYTPSFTDITNSIARIDVKADEINSTVNGVKQNISDNYSTTAQMNSAINQKANEITSTVELTKRAGVELLPQSLKINSTSGFFAIQGSLKCDYWGLFTGERSWWRSEAIQVDTSQPFYYRFEYECNEGYSPQIYIGLEQWRTPSESMGENDRTVYVVTGTKTTGWQCAEGTIDASNFESDTRYIRLRVLVNWDNSPMARFTIFNMSLKQLRDMNSSTQIAQMSDKIESKVDVDGVKSTITQSASEVVMAFNSAGDWDGTSGNVGRILFNGYGIHSQASDGSYSTLGSGQVEHYIAGANYKYHSLTYVETIVSTSQWCAIDGYYYVPERFRNKSFNVVATVSHVAFDRSVGDAYKNLNISVTEINPANCSYRLHCSPIGVNIGGQYTVNASRLEVVVTVIA